MTRELTIEEANALVPELHRIVSAQMLLQDEIAAEIGVLHGLEGHLPRDLAVRSADAPEVVTVKERIMELLRKLDEGWSKIAELGGLVKDPQIGLVDFHGRVDGEEVLLCWRFGEESIDHYHGLEEGFASRRPLANVARHRILN